MEIKGFSRPKKVRCSKLVDVSSMTKGFFREEK